MEEIVMTELEFVTLPPFLFLFFSAFLLNDAGPHFVA